MRSSTIVSFAGNAPARSKIDEIIGRLDGEVAGDLTGTAGDRAQDARRRNHLAVENDGEQFSDIFRGDLTKPLAAANVEAEIDDRLLRAAVEAGLRIGQILALHHDPLLDRQFAGIVHLIQELDIGRVGAGLGDEAEFELCRRAENFLELARILQTGHLDENAIVALALDIRLGRAERIDAAAQHFDRLLDRAADLAVDARLGHGELNEAIVVLGHVESRSARRYR